MRPKPPGNPKIRRLLVADAIGQVHEDSQGTYGYRRAQAALRIERDLTMNHKLVAKVIADGGLPVQMMLRILAAGGNLFLINSWRNLLRKDARVLLHEHKNLLKLSNEIVACKEFHTNLSSVAARFS